MQEKRMEVEKITFQMCGPKIVGALFTLTLLDPALATVHTEQLELFMPLISK